MRTLYLDCAMGAAGDMLAAALLELHPDPQDFLARLNALGIPGVAVSAERSEKCGIQGTHFSVRFHGQEEDDEHSHEHHYEQHHEHSHGHHHEHRGMTEISACISALPLPERVKEQIRAVYQLVAEAESQVHGKRMEQIHFHELGSMDALADITAVCMLLDELGAEQILASPVHVGSGTVRCAHGILPVPAPATALLLRGVPIYAGAIRGELCTPTGAALLRHFVQSFGELPLLRPEAIGYGMGKKDFPQANCLRAILGEQEREKEEILELSCNVDDMSGEEIGFCMERLLEEGALDVFTSPIGMKKSRPAQLIRVLCRPGQGGHFAGLLLRYTSTLGVREVRCGRYALRRSVVTRETRYGSVRCKLSEGYGVTREKYEYEDLAEIARRENKSLSQIRAELEQEKA